MGSISLSGSSTECASALSLGAAFAYAGLLLQSAPHPLGVPAVGENEYVWTSDTPAKLEIPARAYAYAWGWEPDLGWFADNTLFRVEPPIESERTQPGFRTIARGRELIAQSRDQYGAIDDLVFVRSHLPPSNKDFGKKNVYFVVEGNKVDYAEVEIFFPPDATNHPPDGPEGYVMLLENPDERCPRWRRLRRVDTPNTIGRNIVCSGVYRLHLFLGGMYPPVPTYPDMIAVYCEWYLAQAGANKTVRRC